MRPLIFFLGIVIGVAGYLISGTIGWGAIGLGVILLLWGFFSRRKRPYENYSAMRPGLSDAQVMPRYIPQ